MPGRDELIETETHPEECECNDCAPRDTVLPQFEDLDEAWDSR